MNKIKIGLLYVSVLFATMSFGQCLVNYKEQMNEFEGEYLHHLEVNNTNAQDFSMVLNGGTAFYFYVFNTSHKTGIYHLFQTKVGDLVELDLQEKNSTYLLYRLKVERVQVVEFTLLAESKEKACAVVAVMEANDYEEQTLTFARKKVGNPPGTVRVNEKFYVDKMEVRNVDYREYMYWLQEQSGKESEEYQTALPDTNCWSRNNEYDEPLSKYYFNHLAYGEYPLVGVSYEQALAFCQWRSDRVNLLEYWKTNKHLDIEQLDENPQDVPQVFKYRLPTKEEWESLAKIGYSESELRKINKAMEAGYATDNFAPKETSSVVTMLNDNCEITAPIASYFPNKIGLYSLLGNVAEMIQEEGIAKGGSWIHKREEVTVEKDFEYTKPEPWLGFRCVCEKVQ